jgi:hypothetical protein
MPSFFESDIINRFRHLKVVPNISQVCINLDNCAPFQNLYLEKHRMRHQISMSDSAIVRCAPG